MSFPHRVNPQSPLISPPVYRGSYITKSAAVARVQGSLQKL